MEVAPRKNSREAALAKFWRDAINCRVCATIAPYRKFQPAARGTPRYHVMIVGEAPGRVSLDNARPFSNPSNLIIRNAFARAVAPLQIEPEDLVYFTDAVKCWPASKSGANRSPTQSETATCVARHLEREIAIIKPRLIFAFGLRAAQAVLGRPLRMAEAHGIADDGPEGAKVYPLMHPSSINIAGMRRVGIRSITDYEDKLAALFRAELAPIINELSRGELLRP
jgi:DNA polymerase